MVPAPRRVRPRSLRAGSEEEEGDADRWVLSYADFITLLFAFFVVMYSISSVNDGKFRVLSESMVAVFQEDGALPTVVDFGGGMPGMYRTPTEDLGGAPVRVLEQAALDDFPVPVSEIDPRDLRTDQLAKQVEHVLKGAIEMEQVNVRETEDWTEVQLDSEFMFDSGQGRMNEAAAGLIEQVAAIVRETDTPVRVEGFTDDIPVAGGPYGSNWELSAARAASVAHAFTQAGVEPERLSATGFGDLFPVADNATVEGRRENRRVVVAIAKHRNVGTASVTAAPGGEALVEELPPLQTLERVTELPAPATIEI